MPRNGSGQYNLPYDWNDDKANGIKVLASRMQTQDEDIGTALTQSVAADGQTSLTGDLDFNNNKAVDLADGSDLGDAINVSQDQTGETQFYGVSTTTPAGIDGEDYDIAAFATISTYPTYIRFSFICHFTCIAAPNARLNALAAKNLVKSDGANGYIALEATDIIADKEYVAIYNEDISTTEIIIENPENYSVQSGATQTKIIAAGVLTVNKNYSSYAVDTEAAAATDDLDTITGGEDGQIIFLNNTNNARNVILKHATGNIWNPNLTNITLDVTTDLMSLRYSSVLGYWVIQSISTVSNFLNSKTTNGYTYLPNGLIEQFGFVNNTTAGATTNFPIIFPNACLGVYGLALANNNNTNRYVVSFNTSGFTWGTSGVGTGNQFYYRAIGY